MKFNSRQLAALVKLGLDPDATQDDASAFYNALTAEQREGIDALAGDGADDSDEPSTGDDAPAADANGEGAPTGGEDQTAAERRRVSRIMAYASASTPKSMIENAIKNGQSPEDFAAALLAHERKGRSPSPGGGGPAVGGYRGTQQELRAALTASIVLRHSRATTANIPVPSSISDPDERKRFQERVANMSDRFRDLSMIDYARAALQIAGREVPLGNQEILNLAASTGVLNQIFTDSVNARVAADFTEAPDSTRPWCEEGEVSDFKTNTDVMLGKNPGMERLPRGGEAPHRTLSDEASTYKLARYAEQIRITEEDMIDNSLGLLTDVPGEMVMDAARLRPDLVYSIVLENPTMEEDDVALFHSTHANLGEASSALGSTSISAAVAAMGNQRRNGVPLNIAPRFLIHPHELWYTASDLLTSTEKAGGVTTGGNNNPLKNLNLSHIQESRLGTGGVLDPRTKTQRVGTATNWLLVGGSRTIKVVYRSGTGRRPVVRSGQLDRGRWGMWIDINLDLAAYVRDYRAMYFATGAS